MFREILVAASGLATDEAVFQTALAAGRPFGGHLGFLHIRHDMQQTVLAVAQNDLGLTTYGGVIDSVQREVETRQDQAHHMVAEFCARAQVPLAESPEPCRLSATWRVEAGDEPQCLAAHARTSDLTVLGRTRASGKIALHLLETVLLESGRPLLIAPDFAPNTLGRHVAIAWKDGAEAARVVGAALPLLAAAAAVTIVAVQESSDTHADSDSGKRLRNALRLHNPATTLRVLPRTSRDPVEALLSAVEADGADLLVMGGYSHSRMREAMFGGFTRSVLQAAALPVLMAH